MIAPLGDLKIENVTLKEALTLLKYPYKFCDVNKKEVIVAKGKYGVYLKYDGKNINIGENKESDLTCKLIKELIDKILKPNTLGEDKKSISGSNNIGKDLGEKIYVKNGKFGEYIQSNGKNI